jgi:triphosphoribosyl-dephospho-CoA synthase
MVDPCEPSVPGGSAPRALAAALVRGARAELDLTPKPGLVDLRDNGSHPDLDHARMARSIELLPRYYEELIALRTGAGPTTRAEASAPRALLSACIECGRRAEARMMKAIGANAHRGYIFLSGLVLLAACDLAGDDRAAAGASRLTGAGLVGAASLGALPIETLPPEVAPVEAVPSEAALRGAIVSVAREFFAGDELADGERPGARVRDAHGLGGVRTEALRGLPSVFEAGLPAYRGAIGSGAAGGRGLHEISPSDRVAFHALAALMQTVEDTTAVQRCGLEGLNRVRRDGATLQSVLECGGDPRPSLAAWNEEYRAMRLTMGGVADCLALVMAVGIQAGMPFRG